VGALAHYREHALEHFKAELELPGFRKGHVPEKTIIERIGELAILEEAGEEALNAAYPAILHETKEDIIGTPKVQITKLAIGSPLSFEIIASTFPRFELPDYKKLAKAESTKKETTEVTEKEVEEGIMTLRRMREQRGKEGEKVADENLPPLTDELVKDFGKFENVADFKEKMRDSIVKEKELRAKEKHRLAIVKAIIEKTELTLPTVIVEAELSRMVGQMQDDVERMGVKMADYLTRIKKTEADLRKDWEKDAIERAKMELILDKIAKEEKIEAPQEEVETEVRHLLEHYQDADPIRAASYFSHVIKNEKVFQFLESQA
jgi:FKBP-type peptidyl-prolyl cis-trans isomerase (trigger factor)